MADDASVVSSSAAPASVPAADSRTPAPDARADWARAFAPATVSNVGCGFDTLGFAIASPGDVVTVERRSRPGIEIDDIHGDGGVLPRDPARNTASVAVSSLLRHLRAADVRDGVGRSLRDVGLRLTIHKNMPLTSGLGSSAASGVAALVATVRLLGVAASRPTLLRCAAEAEQAACGSAHADNAAPSLYGGFVLVRADDPGDVITLPTPAGVWCAVVRPHMGLDTREGRDLLGDTVTRRQAVVQASNLAGLVAGLYRGDLDLVARVLYDVIAEPKRAHLVPGFEEARDGALRSGAFAAGLSGSGPSLFALGRTRSDAERASSAMVAAFKRQGMASDRHFSILGAGGARVLDVGHGTPPDALPPVR
ncbi:MAG: homoserine kinase [Acidobacteriota bacterium]